MLLLSVAVRFPLPSFAAFSSSAAGTTSGSFLKLGVGARAMAMGEAYSALADDGTSLYWNPASMVQNPDKHSLTFMHAEHLAGIFYDYLGYAHKTSERAAFGAGVQYLSFGSIAETNASGVQTGDFHPQDLAVSLGAAYEIENLRENFFGGFALGGSVKYIRSQILNHAQTASVDLGVLSPRYFNDRLRLSLVGQNLVGNLKFDQTTEPLPTVVKLGAAYRLRPHWVWALDLQFPRDNEPAAALGTEYLMDIGKGLALAGRLGYNSRTLGDVNGFTGVSFGVGFISKSRGSLDYAVIPFGGLGLSHRISLSLKLGGGK